MSNSLMVKYSTDRIVRNAWLELNQASVASYSSIVAAYHEVISTVGEMKQNIGETTSDFVARAKTAARQAAGNVLVSGYLEGLKLKKKGSDILEAVEVLPKTTIKRKDLIDAIAEKMAITIAINDSGGDQSMYDNVVIIQPEVGESITIGEVCSDLNASLHAAVTELGAAEALSLPDTSDISARVSVLRDTVCCYFRDGYDDVSGYLNRALSRLKTTFQNPIQYINNLFASSGLKDFAFNHKTISESEDYSYTGASPASAYAAKIIGDKLINTLADATAVIGTVFASIIDTAQFFVHKGVDKIMRYISNPVDVEQLGGSEQTIDKFAGVDSVNLSAVRDLNIISIHQPWFQYEYILRDLSTGSFHMDFFSCEVIFTVPDNALSLEQKEEVFPSVQTYTLTTKWLQYCWLKKGTIPSDLLILDPVTSIVNYMFPQTQGNTMREKIANIMGETWYTQHGNENDAVLSYHFFRDHVTIGDELSIKVKTRYKPINIKYFSSFCNVLNPVRISGVRYKVNAQNAVDWIDNILMYDDLYCDFPTTTAEERDFYNSFIFGQRLTSLIFALFVEETKYSTLPMYVEFNIAQRLTNPPIDFDQGETSLITVSGGHTVYHPYLADSSVSVNNACFIAASCGVPYDSYDGTQDIIESHWISNLLTAVSNAFLYNVDVFNDSYNPFFPYSKDKVDWFAPSYKLRTDGDNAVQFANFITGSIIAAAVIAIVITGSIILKKASRKAFVKAEAAKYELEGKITNGTATNADWSAYNKLRIKDNLLSKLSGNLTGSQSTSSPDIGSFASLFQANKNSSDTVSGKLNNIKTNTDKIPGIKSSTDNIQGIKTKIDLVSEDYAKDSNIIAVKNLISNNNDIR